LFRERIARERCRRSQELDLLRPLPVERFDACEHATPRVDSKSLATVRQNQYSLPVRLAGLRVAARIGAREIVFYHDGREVARHERLHGRFGTSVQLDHYLELLALKPGALARSLALRQERERGAWPDCFDQLGRGIGCVTWWSWPRRPGPPSPRQSPSARRAAACPRTRPSRARRC